MATTAARDPLNENVQKYQMDCFLRRSPTREKCFLAAASS